MKTIPQIEKEINRQLDKFNKCRNQDPLIREANQQTILAYINGIGFVLGQKERIQISEKTRERILKTTREFKNGS